LQRIVAGRLLRGVFRVGEGADDRGSFRKVADQMVENRAEPGLGPAADLADLSSDLSRST
jgi:hypothetical protein